MVLFLKYWFLLITIIPFCYPPTTKVKYQIEATSKLFMSISTNINSFNCSCDDKFSTTNYTTEIDAKSIPINFSTTALRINVKSLNCKNPVLNKDLYKTLQAEKYPTILFELRSVIPNHIENTLKFDKEYDFVAQSVITIAGKPKTQFIKVTFIKTSNNTLRIKAKKELSMTEYGLKPQSPVSFIKINDTVIVHLDLYITTQ